MIYRIFNPTLALADIVEHYWYSKAELSGSMIQCFPTPLLQGLIFNFKKHIEHHRYRDQVISLYKKAYFFGQPTCPRVVNSGEKGIEILGVKFTPLGIAKLTGINMEHIADYIIPAEDIWGSDFENLCDEMQSANSIEESIRKLEHFLIKNYNRIRLHYRAEQVHHIVSTIHNTNGTITINGLRDMSNISQKTLERTFLHYLGLNPKFYSQIVRFNTAKSIIDSQSMIGIQNLSSHLDYYDGSHFSAEFKRFSSFTPSEYLKTIHSTDRKYNSKSSKESLRFLESIFSKK